MTRIGARTESKISPQLSHDAFAPPLPEFVTKKKKIGLIRCTVIRGGRGGRSGCTMRAKKRRGVLGVASRRRSRCEWKSSAGNEFGISATMRDLMRAGNRFESRVSNGDAKRCWERISVKKKEGKYGQDSMKKKRKSKSKRHIETDA